jgi:hypothetical protein
MFSVIVAAAIGFVVGAFTPAVGRRIKALFVKESKVVVSDTKAEAEKVVTKL